MYTIEINNELEVFVQISKTGLVMTEAEVITKSKRGLRYLHKYLQQVVYFYSIITKTC